MVPRYYHDTQIMHGNNDNVSPRYLITRAQKDQIATQISIGTHRICSDHQIGLLSFFANDGTILDDKVHDGVPAIREAVAVVHAASMIFPWLDN